MKKMDAFLFDNLEVYHRLIMAFEQSEERFWKQLGRTMSAMVKDLVSIPLEESFGTEGFWDDGGGKAFCAEWLLDFGSAEEVPNEERAPAFWFPQDSGVLDTLGLFGLQDESTVYAAIWGQPISRFSGNLSSAKALWEKAIAGPLKKKGWQPYGEKVTSSTGDWGLRRPILLNHRAIAKAMESDDLRLALTPLEDAIRDFASVFPGMDQMISDVRSKKVHSKKGK